MSGAGVTRRLMLNERDIVVLKNLKNPSAFARDMCKCLMVMLDRDCTDYTWENCLKVLDNVQTEVATLDPGQLNDAQKYLIKRILENYRDLDEDAMERISITAAEIFEWCNTF